LNQRALRLLSQSLGPCVEGRRETSSPARDLEQIKPLSSGSDSPPLIPGKRSPDCFPTNASTTIGPAANGLRVASTTSNLFLVTVAPSPGVMASEYLAATDPLEADFDLLRQALTGPTPAWKATTKSLCHTDPYFRSRSQRCANPYATGTMPPPARPTRGCLARPFSGARFVPTLGPKPDDKPVPSFPR